MMQTSLFEIKGSIDAESFGAIFTPNIKKVIRVVRKYGFDIRVIGGAVRDFLRGKMPRDVDFATNAEPAELMFIFDLEGIEHDDWGIAHGTIKAVFGDEVIDVTSITYKLRISGDRIKIDRKASWETDAARRDLTINAMSVDMYGNLYDYRNGQKDLAEQLVKFNPDAQDKIDQDPYTILRWFKALDLFDDPKWLKKDKMIIMSNASKVSRVKKEKRTSKLLASLKQSKKWPKILKLMCDTGVAKQLDLTCTDE